uniref:Alpha-1-antiproteinase-like n=1 Tax=Pogona vitticeps TaxID=103695 RepID=A0ABM5FPV2_9SAUR
MIEVENAVFALTDYFQRKAMPNFYLCLLLAGFWTFAQCLHVTAHHVGDKNIPHLKMTPGNADFAFKFYKEAAAGAAQNNVFFSPLIISTAFFMLSLGAKSNTLRQLLSGLGFNQTDITEHEIHEGFHHLLRILNSPDAEHELNIGNALFIDEKLKPLKKFLDETKHFSLTGNNFCFLSLQAIVQVYINVHENGTEAAATTVPFHCSCAEIQLTLPHGNN